VALGYKGEIIKDYFINYHYQAHNLTVDLAKGKVSLHNGKDAEWIVHLIDTGNATNTGGRVKKAAEFIGNEPFMLTYGDGVSNVNIPKLLDFHHQHGKLATVTAVRPPARFGGIDFEGDLVCGFWEKPQIGEGWINGGFFVLEPEIVKYIHSDDVLWEGKPMESLAAERQLAAYKHADFWQCMDTLRDVRFLESLWTEQRAPWKVW
jgi:glucose-1-phosphate cytidylyltransferase